MNTHACSQCANPRPAPAGAGILHLWWPAAPVARRILKAAATLANAPEVDAAASRVALPVAAGGLADMVDALAAPLSSVERRSVRALFVPDGGEAGLSSLGDVVTLEAMAGLRDRDWLNGLLTQERLTSHYQPIVRADGKTAYAVEALVRGVGDGAEPVSGGRIMMAARAADMLFPVDLAARTSAVRNAVAHDYRDRLFINFSPAAIYDPRHCLRSTVGLIHELGYPPENIVFEVGEGETVDSMDHLKDILTVYREAGFRIALDDLGAGYASLNALHELRPDYVKMDMALTRNVHADPVKASILTGVLKMARDIGIQTVCEGVETEEEAAWLRAHGADYLQGFLFGRAAADPRAPLQRQRS